MGEKQDRGPFYSKKKTGPKGRRNMHGGALFKDGEKTGLYYTTTSFEH
jgi:hypothetical protein